MSESPTDVLLPDGARSGGSTRSPARGRLPARGLSPAGARLPAAPVRRCLARRTAKLFPDEP
ncbi:hypothetical protein [Streptomyces sp. NPDC090135]|uniref:hypothetical protein n=1 Tax=Streptomyces sp. NPDC090135 TaxID=3365957 RepID=UPI0037F6A65E